MAKIQISTSLQISKTPKEVFEAIIDPAHMTHYFISKSSGKMEAGKTLDWEFPEFPGSFPVRILSVKPYESINFEWDGDSHPLEVNIYLEPKNEGNSTLVKVEEKEMEANEEGLNWLKNNTAGWANFLACLKAYLEYGINLRKGAFDYMKTEN
ncbi:SRPBCC domain-containing protein [Cecembia rubra]|uniref:SRPBCC domain-containing protein n=1 Tax=Cecembia rubra TaxID=1485585 RepID=UPI0027153773|nr:SRPBCC domain-containing protein [Cecembia rubra]